MKKFTFRSLLAIAAAGVLFTACKDENDDGNTSKTTYEFSVKAEDNPISAPADGKTYTILVTSTKTAQAGTSAVAYEVVSSPEWAPAELEQTALVITVAANRAKWFSNRTKATKRSKSRSIRQDSPIRCRSTRLIRPTAARCS